MSRAGVKLPKLCTMLGMDLTSFIRDVPDFPKPGIVFKDISPLLGSAEALAASVDQMADRLGELKIDRVVGIESRGFLFGTPLAIKLRVGFTPVRKPNKLPWSTRSVEYTLEYGTDELHIHEDGVRPGERVLIVDDLLATGGTMEATVRLVKSLGAEIVGCFFVVELGFLNGRQKLDGQRIEALLHYP